MALGRSKCVIKGASALPPPPRNQKQVMPHGDFIDRIRKSLYYGCETRCDDMEVSRPLAEYASELFSEPHKGHSLNRLNIVTAGSVHASPCSLIMALIYLDRLNVTDPGYARRITPQELFIVSMMISTKFYAGHDEEIYLSDWAEDGHIPEERLKQLELEFLCAIDWNIYISNKQFFGKLSCIERTLAQREGLRRGWLTYTELMQMLPSFTLIKFLLNNITVMAVSYAASVMTIAGAFFLASQIPGNALHRSKDTAATVAAVDEHVMPAPPAEHNATAAAAGASSVVTIVPKRNATCTALNVEAELLKLERQYREEALLEELRRRHNEIASDSRLTLPEAVQQKTKGKQASVALPTHDDAQRNWYAFKEEYSEYQLQPPGSQSLHTYTKAPKPPQAQPHFVDCFMHLGNCSSNVYWQLFVDAAQQSYTRLPWFWFKFM